MLSLICYCGSLNDVIFVGLLIIVGSCIFFFSKQKTAYEMRISYGSADVCSADLILIAGVAGLVAGAMSMAAGEYVSVSSQADTEQADLARERTELSDDIDAEHAELAHIYVERGLDRQTARAVATQLMARDPLAAHARDELGISEVTTARPIQAALASAASFTCGAAMPLQIGRASGRERVCQYV